MKKVDVQALYRRYFVDNDSKAKGFFEQKDSVTELINGNKVYDTEPVFNYIASDYSRLSGIEEGYFDLLISQYAGFISQACKRYLKIAGILLANNSHGDAGMAFNDDDYELIDAVYVRNGNYHITDKNLDSFFIPKKEAKVTKEYLEKLGKGLGYTKTASSYIFRRIS